MIICNYVCTISDSERSKMQVRHYLIHSTNLHKIRNLIMLNKRKCCTVKILYFIISIIPQTIFDG